MPFPSQLLGPGDWVRLCPQQVDRRLREDIETETKQRLLTRLLKLRGRIRWMKCVPHRRLAFADVEWHENERTSSVTSPFINMLMLLRTDKPFPEENHERA